MNTHVRPKPAAFDLTPAEAASGWLASGPSSPVRTGGGYCHVLPHAEAMQGVFGMVTALIVQA